MFNQVSGNQSEKVLRVVLMSILIILGLAFLYGKYFGNPLGNNSPGSLRTSYKQAGNLSNPIMESSPKDLPGTLQQAYQLKPDARFRLAVSEVIGFFTHQNNNNITFAFREGQWEVAQQNHVLGTVPEFPDFNDFTNFLVNLARTLNQSTPLALNQKVSDETLATIQKNIDEFFPEALFAGLEQIKSNWQSQGIDPRLLQKASHMLTLLSLQSYDAMDRDDLLIAKALALLSITKAMTDGDTIFDEALLAHEMQYENNSRQLAGKLPEGNPLQLYLLQGDQELANLAGQNSADTFTKYCWLRRAAENENYQEWHNAWMGLFAENRYQLPLIRAALQLKQLGTNDLFSDLLPHLVVVQLIQNNNKDTLFAALTKLFDGEQDQRKQGAAQQVVTEMFEKLINLQGGNLANYFEKLLSNSPAVIDMPLLDKNIAPSFYQNYFYSGLYVRGLYFLKGLSSVDDSVFFAETLDGASGPVGRELAVWFKHVSGAEAAKNLSQQLGEDIQKINTIGVNPLLITFGSFQSRVNYGDPWIFASIRRLASLMDTRPSHRYRMVRFAGDFLYDLKLTEKLWKSLNKDAAEIYPSVAVQLARHSGHASNLLEIISNNQQSDDTRFAALGYVAEDKTVSPAVINKAFDNLLKKNPENWDYTRAYADFLKSNKEYNQAEFVIKQWLDRDIATAGLETVIATTQLAKVIALQNKLDEAWKIIHPVIESWQAGAMLEGAHIQDQQGHPAAADAIYLACRRRYPQSFDVLAGYILFLWKNDRLVDAADQLKNWPYSPDQWEFRSKLAKPFVDTFGKDLPRALEIITALTQKGVYAEDLQHFADIASQAGNNELAFKIESQIHASGIESLMYPIRASKFLKRWKGEAEATAWAAQHIPQAPSDLLSMLIFTEGEYHLLWSTVPKGITTDFVQLIRAAALLRDSTSMTTHRDELLTYYKANQQKPYDKIGAYLLDLVPQEEVMPLLVDPKKRCELSYYLGLKNDMQGKTLLANDWYRISVETGLIKNGEYRWSQNRLLEWINAEQFLH